MSNIFEGVDLKVELVEQGKLVAQLNRDVIELMTPSDGSVIVKFTTREDGGLSVSSPTLPGLILSGSDPSKVAASIPAAIRALRDHIKPPSA